MVDICFPCLVVGLLLLFLIVSNFVGAAQAGAGVEQGRGTTVEALR